MIFSTNEARNKCNASFAYDYDWAIIFLKCCNYFFKVIVGFCMKKSIYNCILVIQDHLQGQIQFKVIRNYITRSRM